jgi:hypothetical protein
MPLRSLVVPLVWLDQEPLLYFRIVPPAPIAKQVVVLGQAMPLRLAEPTVWLVQGVLPPLVVATIVPLAPTAKQLLASEQAVPLRFWLVPLLWLVQVPLANAWPPMVPPHCICISGLTSETATSAVSRTKVAKGRRRYVLRNTFMSGVPHEKIRKINARENGRPLHQDHLEARIKPGRERRFFPPSETLNLKAFTAIMAH